MTDRAGAFAHLRVRVSYWWRHGRWPNLAAPRTFTEHVQWRKLNDRCPALAALTDKMHGKEIARQTLGASVIPTVWSGTRLPERPPVPYPLIVKANHGCNQSIVVRDGRDWARAREVSPRWLRKPYGGWLDEWHYRAARRRLLIEPFIGPPDGLPVDYKVYVFAGRAEVVQIHLDRGEDHRWIQFDRGWRRLSSADGKAEPAPPETLALMLASAEQLAADHDFLRVDFYEIDGRLLFGEFCLFPGSGLDPFDPSSLDLRLGALWPGPQSIGEAAPTPNPIAVG